MPLTTVVIPVKNEDHQTLLELLYQLDQYGFETIVIDDGSQHPVLGADIRFEQSRGYGAALKAGIDRATTDLVATMDGDGQHTAYDIKRLEDFMVYFSSQTPHSSYWHRPEMVVGDRRLKERVPKRYWGRKFLNWTASAFAGRFIPDLNSGLRIFKRNTAIGYFPILCDGFSFTTSLTLSMLADGYHVDFLPVKVYPRFMGQSKVRLWVDGWVTLWTICWIGVALRTRKVRAHVRFLTHVLLCRN